MYQSLLKEKPNFTNKINSLLSAFYRLSRERGYCGQHALPLNIHESSIIDYTELHGSCNFELDLFLMIMTNSDDYYLELTREKRIREAKK